jgi:hypothetical protein
LVLSTATFAQQSSLGERLLPATTKGVVLITDVDVLAKHWDATELGKLMADPVMEPFAKDLRRQFQDRLSRLRERLGVKLDDLRGVPSGEMDIALIQPGPDKAAVALLADVTGHLDKARELLVKVSNNLKAKGAKETVENFGGVPLIIYDLPETADYPANRIAYFFDERAGLLGAADDIDEAKRILTRKAGQATPGGTLRDIVPFQKVMSRCQQHDRRVSPRIQQPQIRWYLDPMGYAECVRTLTPEKHRRKGRSVITVFRNQGFDAIQGIGGFIDFKVEGYELLHRTAVYAPGPYKNMVGMDVLTFPNSRDHSLPAFIPNDVATCTTFQWNMLKAFDNIGPTFNELNADEGETGLWDDLIRDFKEDKYGPQIDLREELVKYLDDRIVVISDYVLPITTTSERLLFAVKVRNPQQVAAAMKKLLKDDPTIRGRKFEGLDIWETVEQEEMDLPEPPDIELPNLTPEKKKPVGRKGRSFRGEDEEEQPLLPHASVTVCYGHLLIASHYDYLVDILKRSKKPDPLANCMDYRVVSAAMDRLGAGEGFLRSFSRTDEEYRPTYELIRAGKMPEAETLFGRMLNSLFGPQKPGVIREQKVDGREMPPYQIVRRYLGPAGIFGRTESEGWFVVGFTLKK